jgi:hypothetical protein
VPSGPKKFQVVVAVFSSEVAIWNRTEFNPAPTGWSVGKTSILVQFEEVPVSNMEEVISPEATKEPSDSRSFSSPVGLFISMLPSEEK